MASQAITAGGEGQEDNRGAPPNGNFDFSGWEDEGSATGSMGSSIDREGEKGTPKGQGGKDKRKSRNEFMEASHGREAGSLSPVASLKQCSLVPGSGAGVKRSISPLRMRQSSLQPQAEEGRRRDSVGSEDQEEVEDDGFDTWRGLTDEKAGGNPGDSMDLGFNLLREESLDGPSLIENLLRPSDSMEEGLQALVKGMTKAEVASK